MLSGTVLTAVLWPAFSDVAAASPREAALLPDDLGLPLWTVVLMVTALAVLAAMIGRRLDPRGGLVPWRLTTGEAVALALAVAFAAVDGRGGIGAHRLAGIAGEISREADHVEALELAEWIRAGEPRLRIIAVGERSDSATYRIPGSEPVPMEALATLRVGAAERLVLYSEGGAHAAQAWVLMRARGVNDALVLKDGLAAWEDEVLAPVRPASTADTAQARYARARELSLWFGGMPRLVPLPDDARQAGSAPRRRRNTC
jgi:rhodanese-related sulfurtransferase